ncbi:hypothetical protein CC80DRAFT_596370 [Byssothecium circinans]|uniref:DUF6594 domain-containing protein n=1 Tax=Byssothecium circinans TaxID=147558 RepID=A0A6A5TM06_9PLEO|nr:hypothetical protein CC80DRAFT_596370 [Byssothecium circinans]
MSAAAQSPPCVLRPSAAGTPHSSTPQSPPIRHQKLSPSSTTSSAIVPDNEKHRRAFKYEGYQAFSVWMATEDDFFLFRRFDSLNAQTILWMQDRISRIEEDLQTIHKQIENTPDESTLGNDSFRLDEVDYIDAFSKLRARPLAEPRKINNVKKWLKRKTIASEETAFIEHTHDLITINHRVLSPLNRFLESFTRLHASRLFRTRPPPTLPLHRSPASSHATIYSSNARFEIFSKATIVVSGLVMLPAPMWWLEYVSGSEARLKIITGFVVVFIGVMSLAVVGRPFEVVAATAAYAAVLMVFMQIDT